MDTEPVGPTGNVISSMRAGGFAVVPDCNLTKRSRASAGLSAWIVAEVPLENMVYAALAYATIPSGRIATLDSEAAGAAPGVVFVMTYRNAPRLNRPALFGSTRSSQRRTHGTCSCTRKPHHRLWKNCFHRRHRSDLKRTCHDPCRSSSIRRRARRTIRSTSIEAYAEPMAPSIANAPFQVSF